MAESKYIFPASFAQQRLWFIEQLQPGGTAYHVPLHSRLKGPLDISALEKAVNAIISRHEVLRTTFDSVEGQPVQVISPVLSIPISVIDFREEDPRHRESQCLEVIRQESDRLFDLQRGPLVRVSLVQLADEEHVLSIVMHHIVSDGWSMEIFYRELGVLYQDFCAGRGQSLSELEIQYADFAEWQRAVLQGDFLEENLKYWKTQLQDAPPHLEMPADYARPAMQTFNGEICSLEVETELLESLRKLAQQEDATLFMTALAAFYVLLHRQTGQDDIVVGSPIAGRSHPQVQDLIGFFVNTLALRVRMADSPTSRQLLRRVKEMALSAYAHQELPFEKLVEALQLKRSLAYTPVFQVFFNLVNFNEGLKFPGLAVTPYGATYSHSKFDLTLYLVEELPQPRLDLIYNTDLFTRARAEELLQQFRGLLEQIVADPDEPITNLSLSTKTAELPDPEAPFSLEWRESVPARFSRQAKLFADRVAITSDAGEWTYGELEAHSNRFAASLRNSGIQKGDVVAICGYRSPQLVCAMLAALKSGAAFTIFDPGYPALRLMDCAEVARPKVWIRIESGPVNAELEKYLEQSSCRQISLPPLSAVESWQLFSEFQAEGNNLEVAPQDLAYIVFTSGTTGKPNGVATTHASLSHFLSWHAETFSFSEVDRFSMLSGLSHDPLLRDVFTPLWVGARLSIPTPEIILTPQQLRNWIEAGQITAIHATPALLRLLTEPAPAGPGTKLAALRYAFSGGDVLTRQTVAVLMEIAPSCVCVNFYGTSETPQAMAYYIASDQARNLKDTVPIGRGIDGVQLLVVNKAGQLACVGEPGELYVRTPYLAKGYVGNGSLTRERFIANPFTGVADDKVYQTGDLGRYLPDGNVEFLGRADGQFKVRNFRIEGAEVEGILRQHPAVKDAVVCAREMADGTKLLLAYLTGVSESEQKQVAQELRSLLRARLPEYMVPAAFVPIPSVPLTPNNKVDYRALPMPSAAPASPEQGVTMPRTALEREIAQIWSALLPVKQVGLDDNFFDLGGNSLLLVRVHYRLQELTGREITLVDLFRYPTVGLLARFLGDAVARSESEMEKDIGGEKAGAPNVGMLNGVPGDIAIIGMAGRFPGARNIQEYWRNLCNGVESIAFLSDAEVAAQGVDQETLRNPRYVKASAAIEDIEKFDAAFFGINPREAELTDPQHRLFLECAWEALEDAGYPAEQYSGSVGVFAGASVNTYLLRNLLRNHELIESTGGFSVSILHGNDKDYLASRVSYKLGLRGPSISIQTACSTSLVAVSRACQSLIHGECDMAMAGGVSANVWQKRGYMYETDSILSPDGHCRVFDAQARGTIFGSGVGIVVLKPLHKAMADGDQIYAVIKGSAVNNDGALKVGYTAPSVEGQAAVIREAMAHAGVEPESIGYVEAHGTGTMLGDPVEMAALTQVFRSRPDKQFCAVGSVKSNVGHLNAAAGVAGLIKAALAVKNGKIPPSLHYEQPNPQIDFAGGPFYVNTQLRDWNGELGPRRASVSSFGIGGTNAHAVLEEAPALVQTSESRNATLLVLSARTEPSLREAASNLRKHIQQHPEESLADVAFTLAAGRKVFRHRLAIVCSNREEAIERLNSDSPSWKTHVLWAGGERPVAMLLSGQGTQQVNMGRKLYETEQVFRREIDRSSEFLNPLLNLDLREIIFPKENDESSAAALLRQTWITQPALYVIERALIKLWAAWGIKPSMMLGHSLGELVAATTAGVLEEEDGLRLVAARGRLMWSTESGAMLSAVLNPEDALQYLSKGISLAAINGSKQVVFSGGTEDIAGLETTLGRAEIVFRRLEVERAFHSEKMDPVRDEFLAVVRGLKLNKPKLKYISNVTGTWAGEEVTEAEYWWRQVREPVSFLAGIQTASREDNWAWLEVGPGEVLSKLVLHEQRAAGNTVVVNSSLPLNDRKTPEHIAQSLAALWTNGVRVDWKDYYQDERRHRVSLPTYPFERQRFWIEPTQETGSYVSRKKKSNIGDWFYIPSWKRNVPLAGLEGKQDELGSTLVFLDVSGVGAQLVEQLGNRNVVTVQPGQRFECLSERQFVIRPGERDDYIHLFRALGDAGLQPATVFHLWLLGWPESAVGEAEVERQQTVGFYSLLYLTQARNETAASASMRVVVAANQLFDVAGNEALAPGKATVLGPCRVIPQEHSEISICCVDLGNEKVSAHAIKGLLSEAATEGNEAVAYRNGYRWIQAYDRLPLRGNEHRSAETRIAKARIKENGVYLITGGTGGIGLTLAEHFAKCAKVKLALTARSFFPARAEWQEWVQTHGMDDSISKKIAKLLELEANGSEAMVCRADVTDSLAMQEVIEQVESRFGPIHGVVHGAGVAGGGLAALKTEDEARRVMAPKLKGTLVLTELLRERNVDWFVLCSSRAAVLGGRGQTDYCAANNFLDSFAHCDRNQGRLTISMNWGAWQEVGMAANTNVPAGLAASRQQELKFAMTPAEATEAFDRALAVSLPQLIISPQDLDQLLHTSEKAEPEAASLREPDQVEEAPPVHTRPEISTLYREPGNAVEQALAGIWQALLGISPVGSDDNFLELGGDSLLATQAISKIRDRLGVEISLRAMFQSPTVAGLAAIISKIATPEGASPIARAAQQGELPLAFAQQRLWWLEQLQPGTSAYSIFSAIRLSGSLNLNALQAAFSEIVRRHEILRTRFPEVRGQAVQVVDEARPQKIPVIDVANWPEAEREDRVLQFILEESEQPFDLAAGPLFRTTLVRVGRYEHALLLAMHHIVSDGWSIGVLLREMETLYQAYSADRPSPLHELPMQYAEYAISQRDHFSGEVLESQLEYWRKQLQGAPTILQLPCDKPRPNMRSMRGATESAVFGPELLRELKEIGRREGVTLFMLMLAAFKVLLSRYSGQKDVLVGSPIAGRNRTEIEGLIGLFVNTLVLRTSCEGDPSFRELLGRVRETCLSAYANQDIPFEMLVDELEIERSLSHSPLFQVVFVLQNTPRKPLALSGIEASYLPVESYTAKFDLNLTVQETSEGLLAWLEYNSDIFERRTIRRMMEHLKVLLEAIAETPERAISELPLLTTHERMELLTAGQEPRRYAAELSIVRWFESQAASTPRAAAVSFEGEQITYAELNRRANRLAHHLAAIGIKAGDRAGICLHRSVGMVVSILAILKAGAAYVPIDPAYPRDRIDFILKDSAVSALITESDAASDLDQQVTRVIYLDTDAALIARQLETNRNSDVTPDHVAYVIYTSGSTGRPKGVLVTHENVIRLMLATEAWFHFDQRDVWTLFHSFAFDFSVWEIWGALLYGGRLVVVPYWVSRTPEMFYQMLLEERVTVLNQTPSAFRQLMQADVELGNANTPLDLRYVIFGGEALDPSSLQTWFACHGDSSPQLINMYGITETTVHVTYRRIRAGDLLNGASMIGQPIPDLQLYLLDENMEPVPVGVAGEIYVGGAGVALGYWNRPELTAQRFLCDPFSPVPGARLYRSGDLARRLWNGDHEYLGRADDQVKIRGFRIELGEIEAALTQHQAVREALVLARSAGSGDAQLTAYLIAEKGQTISLPELRTYLKDKLPEYMVPAACVFLEKFPLTSHGKIDRKALPEPSLTAREDEESYVAPQTPAEQALAEVWAQVLDIDCVGVEDSFFALGGDSIRSIQVRALARERGLHFLLQQLFQYQTVRQLASQITGAEVGSNRSEREPFDLLMESDRLLLPAGLDDAYPLAMLQTGMLFHSELNPDSAVYHDIFSYHLQGLFEMDKLCEAVAMVMERHPVLRTSFDLKRYSEPLQLVHRHVTPPVQGESLCDLKAREQEEVIDGWIDAEKSNPFDWEHAPLFRIQIHERSADTFQLTFSFHHAILDGWSVASLLTELLQVYFSLLRGESVQSAFLPPLFREFVALERESLQSDAAEAYWQRKVEDLSATQLARVSPPVPSERKSGVRGHRVSIPTDVSAGLKRVAQENSVPIKSVLLAAHMRVLSRWTGQQDVVTGLVANGRAEEANGERVLGLFLNTVPMRLMLSGGSWSELVKATFAAEREALPFRRFPLAQIQKMNEGGPLFETVFNFIHFHIYQGLDDIVELKRLGGKIFEETNFPFVANFSLTGETSGVGLNLQYDAGIFTEKQIAAIAGHYQGALKAIAEDATRRYEWNDLFSAAERDQWKLFSNSAPLAGFDGRCVHRLFEQQAQLGMDRLAVIAGHGRLSYGELNRRANQLARYLKKLGVGPEVRVGICVDSGLELVLGALAILKAGGAYVPIDTAYPEERKEFMLLSSGAPVVLTKKGLAAESFKNVNVICLDEHNPELASFSDAPLDGGALPENIAYTIYTSGSTGQPKGVDVTHMALLNLVAWHHHAYAIDENDRATQIASHGFDASVWEIWPYLTAGASLHVPAPEVRLSVKQLTEWLKREEITIAFLPTPLVESVLEQKDALRSLKLRVLLTGGDKLHSGPGTKLPFRLMNHYGPTENAVVATWGEVAPGQLNPPIGKPISNVQAYVLDSFLMPVPVGVPGELYLDGESLARGYAADQEQTASRFVPNQFSSRPGTRLYRTGDLVRWLAEGQLEFLGRIDQQVKIRGFRIELGEIESVLKEHDQVHEAVVIVHQDQAGDPQLAAYVVADLADPGEVLRGYLKERLPEYMVPSAFIRLDRLPLTVNGKLDRKHLPPPDWQHLAGKSEYIPPRTILEEEVARIWTEVLGCARTGIDDNFFALGGDSLKAIRVISRLSDSLHLELPLKVLFDAADLKSFAAAIEQQPSELANAGDIERILAELGEISETEARSLLADQNSSSAKA